MLCVHDLIILWPSLFAHLLLQAPLIPKHAFFQDIIGWFHFADATFLDRPLLPSLEMSISYMCNHDLFLEEPYCILK